MSSSALVRTGVGPLRRARSPCLSLRSAVTMNAPPSDGQAVGLVLSAALSALLQLLVLGAIPALVHRIWFRKREPWARFLGLYAPERRALLLGLGVAALALASFAALNHWLGSDL